jgi:hypothetical protein
MYNLITESIREITISGVVKDEGGSPLGGSKVEFLGNEDKSLKGTITNDEGEYLLTFNSDNGDFKLRATNNNLGYPASLFNIKISENQNTYKLDLDLKSKERKEVVVTKKFQEVSGIVYDKNGLVVNGVIITATSNVGTKNVEQKEDGSYIFRSPEQIQSVTLKFEKQDYKPQVKELDFTEENKIKFDPKLSKKTMLDLKIIDSTTNNPIKGANVTFINLGKNFKTNDEGKIIIKDIETGKEKLKIQFTNYLTKVQNINIKDGENTLSISIDKFGLGGERVDDYKDNLFTIYGRSRNVLSYDEALKDTKLEIVNKFIEKHKKTYKNIPQFKNADLDIKYELVYKKPKTSKEDENFVIVKASKKDIKQFMRDFAAKNNIEIEKEPLTWEEDDLKSLLIESYRQNRNVFIVFGLMSDEQTKKMIDGINNNTSLVNDINKKSKLIYVPNSDQNANKNFLIQNDVDVSSYPRIIVLKPTDLKGNFTVFYNKSYSQIVSK